MLFVSTSRQPTLAADRFAGESETEPSDFSTWMVYIMNNDPTHEAEPSGTESAAFGCVMKI